MVDYREILRLNSLGYTRTDIAASVHSSRNTVQEVLDIAEALQIKWPLDDDVSNHTLESILYPERHKQDEERLLPDYPRIHRELAKKGVTLTLLWTEYCMEAQNAGKKPYMSTQFNDNYHKWARVTKATMRIQHKPGDTMEVDWAGATINIYDEITGEATPAYLFVSVLSCSCYVYAEICSNMRSDTFINGILHQCKNQSKLLLEEIAKTCVESNACRYSYFKRLLQENQENVSPSSAALPEHNNLRGKEVFK